MADEELQMEEGGGKKSKMMLIIIVVVVLAAGGGGAFFFLGGSEEAPMEEGAEEMANEGSSDSMSSGAAPSVGTALYVAMPRPFVFNVPGTGRNRMVQIKAQLLVRGSEDEEAAKKHIPLIEGTLLQVFSQASADVLVTEAGKVELRSEAAQKVQVALNEVAGRQVVEEVLFTGFVMQ